jgi:hypothetical protein
MTDLTIPLAVGSIFAAAVSPAIYGMARQVADHPLNRAALAEQRRRRADKAAVKLAAKQAKQAEFAASLRGWIDAKDGVTDPHYIHRSVISRGVSR